jgi:hypothetical protein
MAGTSSYARISENILVEYIYSNETITTTTARPLRLFNNYVGQYQFLNSSTSVNITGNVLDRSASKIVGPDSTLWAYHDIDPVIPIIQVDNNFKLVDETSFLLVNQKYDTIRVHLGAGYDFPGLDGFIAEVQWEEWTSKGIDGRRFTSAAQVYLKGENSVNFNPNPMFLGDRYFDRYVEFKIPALSYVNEDFWNSPSASNTIGYQYTFQNVGFSQTSPIYFNVYEIDLTETDNDNKYFQVGRTYSTSFNSTDQYSYVGCTVRENVEYDFIEYFPTYYEGFIEDYINDLNSAPGGDWIVINQLNVYEQAGTSLIKTSSSTLLQEGNFNEPAIFRPVIRNSSLVYSFMVEYTMRLINKVSNQEIVRKSTFTSNEPKKYGYSLSRINVLEGFKPVKVYNKIEKIESNTIVNSITENIGAFGFGTPKIITQNLYFNSYYDMNYISVDSTTDISNTIGQRVFPQGTNVIYINKYDNYVKFKVFTKSPDKKQDVTLDLASTGMNIKLSFIFDDDTKIYIDPVQDMNAANPGSGEVLFRIDDAISAKLLAGNNRDYYLINKNEMGDEVLIYSGLFASHEKRVQAEAMTNQEIIDDLNTKISRLQSALLDAQNTASVANSAASVASQAAVNALAAAEASAATATSATELLSQKEKELSEALEKASSFVSSANAGIDAAIKNAAAETSKENPKPVENLNIPEIPGVTQNMGAPISLANAPKVPPKSDKKAWIRKKFELLKGVSEKADLQSRIQQGGLYDDSINQQVTNRIER